MPVIWPSGRFRGYLFAPNPKFFSKPPKRSAIPALKDDSDRGHQLFHSLCRGVRFHAVDLPFFSPMHFQ
jgi:hypothetical protein